MNKSEKDEIFLRMAKALANLSKDPSTKVGCLIVKDDRPITNGVNGFPRFINDTKSRLEDRETKLKLTIHAEENALINLSRQGVSAVDSTLYVTHEPCTRCLVRILNSGIKRIVFLKNTEEFRTRWIPDEDIHLRVELLNELEVEYQWYEFE